MNQPPSQRRSPPRQLPPDLPAAGIDRSTRRTSPPAQCDNAAAWSSWTLTTDLRAGTPHALRVLTPTLAGACPHPRRKPRNADTTPGHGDLIVLSLQECTPQRVIRELMSVMTLALVQGLLVAGWRRPQPRVHRRGQVHGADAGGDEQAGGAQAVSVGLMGTGVMVMPAIMTTGGRPSGGAVDGFGESAGGVDEVRSGDGADDGGDEHGADDATHGGRECGARLTVWIAAIRIVTARESCPL
jgi:hypothetical protein